MGGSGNWYEILGVPPGASDADIGRAFRRLAREFHPDVADDRSSRTDDRFGEIARAYEVLGDADRRADYDRARSRDSSSPGRRVPVRNASRTASRPQRPASSSRSDDPTDKGPQAELEFSLTLRESLSGTTRRAAFEVVGQCPSCRGVGSLPVGACPSCGGRGRIDRSSGAIAIHHVCDTCNGRGERPPALCSACRGSGRTSGTRRITVKVPPGIGDGALLRIQRPGGGTPLLARIRVAPDDRFAREGDLLVVAIPITLAEAALGATVMVTSPTGDDVVLVVPPGTRSGTRLPVEAELPGSLRLMADIEIDVPTRLSDAERAALEAFGRATPSPREKG